MYANSQWMLCFAIHHAFSIMRVSASIFTKIDYYETNLTKPRSEPHAIWHGPPRKNWVITHMVIKMVDTIRKKINLRHLPMYTRVGHTNG